MYFQDWTIDALSTIPSVVQTKKLIKQYIKNAGVIPKNK